MCKTAIAIVFGVLLILNTAPLVNAQSNEIFTEIVFDNENAVAEENLSLCGFGDKDSGYATSTSGGRVYASVSGTDFRKLEWSKGDYAEIGMQPVMTGGTKNPWGNGAYLEVRVSTQGFTDITFSASLGATKKGPRDFKLQYSLDGKTFADVAGTAFTITTNKTMFAAFDGVSLPAEVDDAPMVYIRIAVASNMMVNGTAGLIGSTGGEAAINHIVVSGTPIPSTTTAPPTSTTQCETTVAVNTTASEVTTTALMTSAVSVSQTETTATLTPSLSTTVPNVSTGEEADGFGVSVLLLSVMAVMCAVKLRHHSSF